jgi:hypothetical protein
VLKVLNDFFKSADKVGDPEDGCALSSLKANSWKAAYSEVQKGLGFHHSHGSHTAVREALLQQFSSEKSNAKTLSSGE